MSKFWEQKVYWKELGDVTSDGEKCVRVEGSHFVIGDEDSKWKGHSGRKFKVTFIDGPHKGHEVITTNLWHQGKIDDEFLSELPDNAILKQVVDWK